MDLPAFRSQSPIGASRDDDSLDPAALSDELAISLYEQMVVARLLDERMVTLQNEGVIARHDSAAGEEAAIFGAVAAMNDEDWIFPSSRDVGPALWRGMPLAAYAHHAFGTCSDLGVGQGVGRGWPGPPFWKATNVASVSSLAGTQIPQAVGFAWAARMNARDLAALVFFGEKEIAAGDFHTGLNLAGVTRAPVVALCRSSGKASSPSAAAHSVAYGVAGVQVDGSDVAAVLRVVREARQHAAAGAGATLVEAVIPGLYRTDPLVRMRLYIESRGLWTEKRERDLVAEVRADVDRAITDAAGAKKPTRETLFADVYAGLPWHLKEQGGG